MVIISFPVSLDLLLTEHLIERQKANIEKLFVKVLLVPYKTENRHYMKIFPALFFESSSVI